MLATVLPEAILQKGQSALNVFQLLFSLHFATLNSLWFMLRVENVTFFQKA